MMSRLASDPPEHRTRGEPKGRLWARQFWQTPYRTVASQRLQVHRGREPVAFKDIDIMRLFAELVQVAGGKTGLAEQAGEADFSTAS
jgi:hypothetical protein